MATPEKEKADRKELAEKKVNAVLVWINEQKPAKVLRYNGYVFLCEMPVVVMSGDDAIQDDQVNLTRLVLDGSSTHVWRDSTLVNWWNRATDRMLATACNLNEAMAYCWPQSLRETGEESESTG